MNSRIPLGILVSILLGTAQFASATVIVEFDQTTYNVTPGQIVSLNILLDADGATSGIQSLPYGLCSAGVRLSFNAAAGAVPNVNSIVLAPDLNENGMGGPAVKSVGSGSAGFFGGLLWALDPMTEAYKGSSLATISFTVQGDNGDYTLSLGKYYAPPLTNFTVPDPPGFASLDESIEFRTAKLHIVPEPGTAFLLFAGAALRFLRKRKDNHPSCL